MTAAIMNGIRIMRQITPKTAPAAAELAAAASPVSARRLKRHNIKVRIPR
jgi:hypothetical protein